MCIHLHTRAGEPGYQEMELRGVVPVPWQSDYWVSMMGEGPKEGSCRLKSGSHAPSSPHLCVVFGNLPSGALCELPLASQPWGLKVRPSGRPVDRVWRQIAGTSQPGS